MNRFVIFALLAALQSGCAKEEISKDATPTIGNASSQGHIEDTPGSYFVYEWYEIDSSGNQANLALMDTMRVVGDSLINGVEYIHYQGTYMGVEDHRFYRDSGQWVMNEAGKILWGPGINGDTLSVVNVDPDLVIYSILTDGGTFYYPPGVVNGDTIFNNYAAAYDHQMHHYAVSGVPFSVCDTVWVSHSLYVNGLGQVRSQVGFLSQLQTQCKFRERRLTRYVLL